MTAKLKGLKLDSKVKLKRNESIYINMICKITVKNKGLGNMGICKINIKIGKYTIYH